MPSAALRLRDLRAIYDLTHECRDLGDAPVTWWSHFAAGIGALVGSDFVAAGQVTNVGPERSTTLGVGEWGWEHGFHEEPWRRSIETFDQNPSYSAPFRRYFDELAVNDGVCLSRSDLLSDRDWYRTWSWQAINEPMGIDHYLWCIRRLPTGAGYGMIVPVRAINRRDFTAREKAIVREAHAVLAPLVGGPLARFNEPSPADLAPRVRHVLRCLLEGDSDKQVALRLGISKYTVNQYVKVIFNHFGVITRPELLARWIRRGWGARCVWAGNDAVRWPAKGPGLADPL